ERATDLVKASITESDRDERLRLLLDDRRRGASSSSSRRDRDEPGEYRRPRECSSSPRSRSKRSASRAACSARRVSISCAESRSTAVSYFPASGDDTITCRRIASSQGPIALDGGRISVRSTTPGTPLASRNEVTASPTPTSRIAASVSKRGFGR